MVRCEDDTKKQTTDETMMEMKPTDYYLKDIIEYTTLIVWVRSEIDMIKYKLRRIFVKAVSYYTPYIF